MIGILMTRNKSKITRHHDWYSDDKGLLIPTIGDWLWWFIADKNV